jgi:hypothetical protein
MALDVELRVVEPHWVRNSERSGDEPLSQPRRKVEASVDVLANLTQRGEGPFAEALEHEYLASVPADGAGLELQDLDVLGAEAIEGHEFDPPVSQLAQGPTPLTRSTLMWVM